jgi:hypothetical protein
MQLDVIHGLVTVSTPGVAETGGMIFLRCH